MRKTNCIYPLRINFAIACLVLGFGLSSHAENKPEKLEWLKDAGFALVIITDQVLQAFVPDVSRMLSVYVGLIITNCIVMGRAEDIQRFRQQYEL